VTFIGGDTALTAWADVSQIAAWKEDGLSDSEADHVALKVGAMPYDIWTGYSTAGLDFPDDVR
jgi:hypothetical protein